MDKILERKEMSLNKLSKISTIDKQAILVVKQLLEGSSIGSLKDFLTKLPQQTVPVKHYMVDNLYVREAFLPKGSFCIGAPHTMDFIETMVTGSVLMFSKDSQPKLICEPFTKLARKNNQKCGYVLEDTTWVTSHSVKAKTIKEAELEIITSDYRYLVNKKDELCQ